MQRDGIRDHEVRVKRKPDPSLLRTFAAIKELGFLFPKDEVAHRYAPIVHMSDQETRRHLEVFHTRNLFIM